MLYIKLGGGEGKGYLSLLLQKAVKRESFLKTEHLRGLSILCKRCGTEPHCGKNILLR